MVLEGNTASGVSSLATPFTVYIGGVTVPAGLADGDQPVIITIGGQVTQSATTIPMKQ